MWPGLNTNTVPKYLKKIEATVKAITYSVEIEKIRTTDPMVILREKGRIGTPQKLTFRDSVYNTIITRTVIPFHKSIHLRWISISRYWYLYPRFQVIIISAGLTLTNS